MADRINVLGNESRASTPASDLLLAEARDPVLRRLVEEAARVTDSPMSLVTLICNRIQLFCAHTGLPEDLAAAGATDRDVSFCQFVVRDGAPFVVTDAATDERVPKELVQRYGVRAYFGSPVMVDGSVVGALCVLDTNQRDFSESVAELLEDLAERASARLQELTDVGRGRPETAGLAVDEPRARLLELAGRPAFGEMRNVIGATRLALDELSLCVAEVGPFHRLLTLDDPENALSVLESALKAYDSLVVATQEVDLIYGQIAPLFRSIESLMVSAGDSVSLAEVVDLASTLSFHYTKLAGGVRWPDVDEVHIRGPRQDAVAVLTCAVSATALVHHRCSSSRSVEPVRVGVRQGGNRIALEFPLAELDLHGEPIAARMIAAITNDSGRDVRMADGGLHVSFNLAEPP